MRGMDTTTLLYAKIVVSIVEILKAKNYIEEFHIVEEGGHKSIKVTLRYDDNGNSVISEIKRISKPGRRVYKPSTEIKRFKNGYGTIIVSTSKGVLSNDDAHTQNVGGEVLCSIW
jgi:small subunit ribosomal protein S8